MIPQESALPFLRPAEELKELMFLPPVDLNRIDRFPRVLSAYYAPSQMSVGEALFLYGLVMAQEPARVLEIGFRYGGSSFVMLCALADLGQGRLVSIDPAPEPALDFSRFGDRFQLIRDRSPAAVPVAVAALGGPIDLCLVDGDHGYEAATADLEGVLPHLASDSYLLLHDPVSAGVKQACEEFLGRHTEVIDCGLVARRTSAENWSGLRMLRVLRKAP
jgi:predicted O-methyltransferase YrrM